MKLTCMQCHDAAHLALNQGKGVHVSEMPASKGQHTVWWPGDISDISVGLLDPHQGHDHLTPNQTCQLLDTAQNSGHSTSPVPRFRPGVHCLASARRPL